MWACEMQASHFDAKCGETRMEWSATAAGSHLPFLSSLHWTDFLSETGGEGSFNETNIHLCNLNLRLVLSISPTRY